MTLRNPNSRHIEAATMPWIAAPKHPKPISLRELRASTGRAPRHGQVGITPKTRAAQLRAPRPRPLDAARQAPLAPARRGRFPRARPEKRTSPGRRNAACLARAPKRRAALARYPEKSWPTLLGNDHPNGRIFRFHTRARPPRPEQGNLFEIKSEAPLPA